MFMEARVSHIYSSSFLPAACAPITRCWGGEPRLIKVLGADNPFNSLPTNPLKNLPTSESPPAAIKLSRFQRSVSEVLHPV